MNQLEQFREQCAQRIEQTRIYSSSPKKIFDISQDARNEQAKIIRALPLPEANQNPVAWVMTIGDDIKNHLQFFTCKGIAEQSLIDESEWGLENLKLQPLYFNLPDAEALRKKNEKLNALLLATNSDLMNALYDIERLKEEKKSLQNQVNEFEMKLAKERAK